MQKKAKKDIDCSFDELWAPPRGPMSAAYWIKFIIDEKFIIFILMFIMENFTQNTFENKIKKIILFIYYENKFYVIYLHYKYSFKIWI